MRQRKVRQAIANTKKYRALSEAEKVRQKHLQTEIAAKNELKTLQKKTRQLKQKRGSTDLKGGIRRVGKALKRIDRMMSNI
jgi:hypothetical protein